MFIMISKGTKPQNETYLLDDNISIAYRLIPIPLTI